MSVNDWERGGLIGSGRERCRGVRDLESERMEAGEREFHASGREAEENVVRA